MFLNDLTSKVMRIKPRISKMGLLYDFTGLPIMALASTCAKTEEPVEIQNALELWEIIPQKATLMDRLAHLYVNAFFQFGGQSLIVVVKNIKCKGQQVTEDEFWSGILGHDRSFTDRTGLMKIQGYEGLGDLLLVPQASAFLSSEALLSLYQRISVICDTHPILFGLFDLPLHRSVEANAQWVSRLECKSAAAFYPWVTIEKDGLIPPSVLIAAHIQKNDMSHNIATSIANRDLGQLVYTYRNLSNDEVRMMNQKRVNVIREISPKKWVLWGNYDLSRERRHLSTSRTLKAVRDSLLQICEPYVMEPQNESTLENLDRQMKKFLEHLSYKKVLTEHQTTHQSYSVESRLASPKPKKKSIKKATDMQEMPDGEILMDKGFIVDVNVCIEDPSKLIGIQI